MNAPRVPMNWLPILAICVIALSTRGGSAWDGEEPAAGGVSRGKHRLEYALWSDGLNGSTSDGIPPAATRVAPPAEAGAAHNAWILTCSMLVLFMTAPGLALFYSGLVRKKNVLGVMMQCIFLMGLMTLVWALWGYSLAFGGSGRWLGNADYLFLWDVVRTWDPQANAPVTPMEGPIPRLTHMLFRGMFFIFTPALICGAFAERMKFSALVAFMVLWGTFVYCPLCHWVWDGGLLAFVKTGQSGNGLAGGSLDFAGGTVVHISSGVSALVIALVLGKRLGYGREPMPPHNLTYTAIGAAMLWVGWLGFNAGSSLACDELTSSVFAATHLSAAAGAVTWASIEWYRRGKPSILGTCTGTIAGLVCITPAAGFVNPMWAIVFGITGGGLCYFACTTLKRRLGYDDSLDAFGVHGVGGTLGAILTGVFATRACWNIDDGRPLGLIEGQVRVLLGQVVAVAVTYVFAAVATLVLLRIVDAVLGLRVSQEQESHGLDISQHGEEGYIFR
jgi:ammonium transporter, Amt family